MSVNAADAVSRRIVDVTADCGISLVASLPDGWITSLITHCMNPGMLLVECQLALPNLKHFVISNRVCGSTNDLGHPFGELMDYAGIAKACGIERIYDFATLQGLAQGLDDMIKAPGYAFAVLRVDPLGRHLPSPPLDGPEVKFRFGRYLERTGGRPVFDAPLHPK